MAEQDRHDPIYCQLCGHQSGHGQRSFLCLPCASADVYEARFDNAQNILQKEALGREISNAARHAEALTGRPFASDQAFGETNAQDLPEDGQVRENGTSDAARRLAYDELRSARADAKLRTRDYDQTIQEMEEDCQDLREEIRRRKDDIRMRRERIRTTGKTSRQRKRHQQSDEDLADRLEAINLASAKIESRFDPQQRKLTDARAYMVREAATLWGLSVKRKRSRDGKIREMAYLAGLPVPDLRDLLSARPEHLNASVVAIVYMLNQACSYLGLKLPSQPLLPDQEHAYPRILPIHSSYVEEEISNPSSIPRTSTSKSNHNDIDSRAAASDATGDKLSSTDAHSPRARALHLKQPLLKLYSEDTLAYESFVEAMSLLAWDVAWLAKIQGNDVAYSKRHGYSWEGVCDLGRNLWILFGPHQQPRSTQNKNTVSSDKDIVTDGDTKEAAAGPEDEQLTQLGAFSHGTSRNNAAGAEGAMLGLNAWRLGNPNTVIRRLKDSLADRKMAGEWELLEEEEWDQAGADMARQGSNASANSPYQQTSTGGALEQAAKGWQKLRPRNSGE